MSSTTNGMRWKLGRGGWGAVAFWLGVAAASATSCLDANEEHCFIRGGDSACAAGEICVFAPEGGSASGVGDDGCFEVGEVDDVDALREEIPEGFFHAKYGFPAYGDEMLQSPAVEGMLSEDERADLVAIRSSFDAEGCQTRKSAFDLDLGGATSCADVVDDPKYAEEAYDNVRALCDYYEVIDEAEVPPDTDTDTETATTDDTDTVDETTASSSDTGPEPCGGECKDEAAPVCDPETDECVPCNADAVPMPDMACAEAHPEQSVCREDGRCVQCTEDDATVCTSQGLLCDEESGACVPCTEHGQCASGACALVEGTCVPEDVPVLHVDGDGGQMYTDVAMAVAAVADGATAQIVVHEQDGADPYTEELQIAGGKTIWLLAAAGVPPILQGTDSNPGLRVEGAGTILYMEGLRISQSSGVGLQVTDATVWVDRSRIVQNTGGGIVASGAALTVRNSFVATAGNGISAVVVTDSDVSIVYSTLFSSAFAPTAALRCAGTTTGQLRNSIVVTEGGELGDEFECFDRMDRPSLMSTYSATEALLPGEGNEAVGSFPDGIPEEWFIDVSVGNLGLQNEGVAIFEDVARWRAGDPPIDIEGDARPGADGALDFAGADVPP